MTNLARRLSRGFVEEAKNTATLHGFVLGVGALFSIASVLDPTFRDALETQKVCDGILRSAAERNWVEIS